MAWIRIRKFIRFYLLAFVSALLLLTLTLLIYFETYQRVKERNEVLFNIRAESAKDAVAKRIRDYTQILKGAQGLLNVSDTVTRQEWKNYVDNLNVDKVYPGILGIGYSRFFPERKLPAFEAAVQSAGFPGFKVWPEDNRDYYSSIIYLEPFNERNQRAFGYDMFTNDIRREAMKRAGGTGEPSLSGMVTLVQEKDVGVQKGFLLYLPVYQNGEKPQTLRERQAKLKGFVYSPFRVNDLMNGIFRGRYEDLDLEIYDGTEMGPGTLLFDKEPSLTFADIPSLFSLQQKSTLTVGGHQWLVFIRALPDFGYETTFPWFILGGGVLMSVLLFFVMFSMANIRRSTYLNEVITDNATAALFILDPKDYCTFMNPAAEILTGFTLEEIQQDTLHNMVHHSHPDGSYFNPADCAIFKTLNNRGVLINEEDVFYRKNGEKITVSINARPLYERGMVTAFLLEVRDITQEKLNEKALKKRNRDLQTLNHIGKNLSAELDLQKLLQEVTDSCTELAGAEFGAFFYNQQDAEKESSYMLYTLSGVPPEAFSKMPMPRATKIFEPTFKAQTILRSDDITQDPRFGQNAPYKGMPAGHLPVKSYLAIPVVSRGGDTVGGLFFGHSKRGVFTENTEEIVVGIASQAAIAIDNSRLFETTRKKNTELIRINNDLDNFVYTASHDLKAPVLNIEGLLNALKVAMEKKNTDQVDKIVEMMNISVLKFKETIQALTDVARTNKNLDEKVEEVDLQEILEDIRLSVNELIIDAGVRIQQDLECGLLHFSKPNLRSILLNLITNAIKYRSPERLPLITVSCHKKDDGFVTLKVKDNGLGIPASQLSKIFVMFKRYHTHTEGTGVGLYLVKRIVENYGGTIGVESVEGQGSTFTIELPQDQ
ncbi:CHASE domain-containing protein [Nafulsella turpanensis]|uniref:CHASE domain-containing protein n=1 Tax=Nafulsella turpanensis TaxID=1265690 RepID=UPI00036EC1CE|nr:CHASE domain-containing protein [Nafulsella turpanensis]